MRASGAATDGGTAAFEAVRVRRHVGLYIIGG